MVKKCNLVVFNAEMVSIGAKKNELLRPSTLVGASQSNSMKSQSVDLLVERLRRLGSARSARKLSLSIKFQFIGRMLDFLEEHLPERLRPLLEKARELLPDPEIGQQQEQQQHQRGMGGMEL